MPAPFQLYNTRTRTLEAFQPIEPGHIRLYVCGMTVYDHAHVGHGRAMVVFDAFVRYLRHRNWSVRFVRNFTDVDDKIISRAAQRGIEPMELAEEFITAFQTDAQKLGLIEPDEEPRVSTSIQDIIDMIQILIDKGHAYVNQGSVWFSVPSYKEYGQLSGQKVDELRSADAGAGKTHSADFALWKAVKPGEPSWESPFGPGRPGWHIECSAMSKTCLGEQIDIHGGGLDLVFPHHENEVAQSECSSGKRFSNFWMHNGLLTMTGGQKMGKSLGNVINIRDALVEYPAEAVRLYLLQNH
jgi:cysteinyl-tRNA synthetase